MIATALSTVFGIGHASVAPGTVASAVALPFAWLILWAFGPLALLSASLVIYAVGIWSCGVYAQAKGIADPSECVIDEVAGQWLSCTLAPPSLFGFVIAFALFRFFDISKLWPVSLGERLDGGWGVMTDDMIAGALTMAIIAVLRWHGLV